jgi:hypothetical protein
VDSSFVAARGGFAGTDRRLISRTPVASNTAFASAAATGAVAAFAEVVAAAVPEAMLAEGRRPLLSLTSSLPCDASPARSRAFDSKPSIRSYAAETHGVYRSSGRLVGWRNVEPNEQARVARPARELPARMAFARDDPRCGRHLERPCILVDISNGGAKIAGVRAHTLLRFDTSGGRNPLDRRSGGHGRRHLSGSSRRILPHRRSGVSEWGPGRPSPGLKTTVERGGERAVTPSSCPLSR